MQYAFFIDSEACSGCKTCQVACKDKNDLRAGVHYRRVIEVTAGGWQRKGESWVSTVQAYNLSVACHHCNDPVCGKSCSTEAIWKRPDGIVLIDQSKCTKCFKCRADCPYDAIRYDAAANAVGKCDLCVDRLETGKLPVCVTACPNRALHVGDREELKSRHGNVDRVFPLADPMIAGPSLVIRPHRSVAAMKGLEPQVANWEEI
jgi:anaerobic dimethyl sulfoxide reductase subunit B (iron-sulfur subunit)